MLKSIPLTDHELKKQFEEYLDETLGEINVGALSYYASNVLKSVDPIAYNEEFSNWLDMMLEDGILHEYDGEYYDHDPSRYFDSLV